MKFRLNSIITAIGLLSIISMPLQASPSNQKTNQSQQIGTNTPRYHDFKGLEPISTWHPFAGISLLYLQPFWKTNPAYIVSSSTSSGGGSFTSIKNNQTDFDYDYTATPIFTIGIMSSSGVGLRGRYWWFNNEDTLSTNLPFESSGFLVTKGISTSSPLGLGFNVNNQQDSSLQFKSKLNMRIADAEMLLNENFSKWNLLLSAGARYAWIEQDYNARGDTTVNLLIPPQTRTLRNRLDYSQIIHGFGPTISAEANYPFQWHGLGVYGNGRASFIFGTNDEHVTLNTIDVSNLGIDNTAITESRKNDSDGIFTILETELGFEWLYTFKNGVTSQLRLGVVAQNWLNVGNSSNNDTISSASSFGSVTPETTPNTAIDMAIFGFVLTGMISI